jgi:hypothetical protein
MEGHKLQRNSLSGRRESKTLRERVAADRLEKKEPKDEVGMLQKQPSVAFEAYRRLTSTDRRSRDEISYGHEFPRMQQRKDNNSPFHCCTALMWHTVAQAGVQI